MITGQVGLINYMTNLHIDKYTFSETMLQLRIQVFEMSLFKGAGIVFLRHPAFLFSVFLTVLV
jgi:hypothetical protein